MSPPHYSSLFDPIAFAATAFVGELVGIARPGAFLCHLPVMFRQTFPPTRKGMRDISITADASSVPTSAPMMEVLRCFGGEAPA